MTDYLVNQGQMPMRDFFYPYGNLWLFSLFPEGQFFAWIWQGALLAVAAWSLWRFSGQRAARVILCLLVLAVLVKTNLYGWRYFAALMIPISYAALGPARHRRPTWGHLVFAAACALGILLEADVLLFGLAGMAFVLVGEISSGRLGWEPRALLRGLLIDSLPVLGVIAVLAAIWLITGTAEGNGRWFGGVSTFASFAAPNEVTDGGLRDLTIWPSLNSASVTVVLPALLAAAGLLHSVFGSERDPRVGPILLAGSAVSTVLMLKFMARPLDWVLVITPMVLLWSAILLWRPRALVVAAVVGAFLGASFVTLEKFQDQKLVSTYAGDALQSPVQSGQARSACHWMTMRWRRRLRSVLTSNGSQVVRDRRPRSSTWRSPPGQLPSFAVLGDAQLLYPIFRQSPPFHSEYFDLAPIYEQRVLSGEHLKRESPSLLVWRRDFAWDRIPYHVRDPLVFNYAVDAYVPLRRHPTTDVLRQRRPDERIPVGYWRQRLGSTVDLGFIPSLSDALGSPAVRSRRSASHMRLCKAQRARAEKPSELACAAPTGPSRC